MSTVSTVSTSYSGVLYDDSSSPRVLTTKGILFVAKNDLVNTDGGLAFIDGLDGRIIVRSAIAHHSPTETLEFLPIDMLGRQPAIPPSITLMLNDIVSRQTRNGGPDLHTRIVKLRNAIDASDYEDADVDPRDGQHIKTARELQLLANYVRHNDTCICPDTFARYCLGIQRIFEIEDRCECPVQTSRAAKLEAPPPSSQPPSQTATEGRKLLRNVIRADDQSGDDDGDGLSEG